MHLSHHRLMPSPLIVLLAGCSITQLSNQSINKQWWAMVSKF
ncbi:putative lipoprotein [Vibrio cholerae HC-43B1]|nr:putative lipoprotein [Vibrio cholerae HC-43B1]EKM07010.1 putative lipoprotein [Vibrio cholerae HC-44C1]